METLRGGSSEDDDEKEEVVEDADELPLGAIDNPWEYFTRKPLADPELAIKLLDLVKECQALKQIKRGANEVTKAINRNIAEFIIIGADTEPIELVLHLPMLCEDKGVPYIWIPSREDLGKAAALKYRSVTAVAILVNDYSKVKDRVVELRTQVDLLRGDDTSTLLPPAEK